MPKFITITMPEVALEYLEECKNAGLMLCNCSDSNKKLVPTKGEDIVRDYENSVGFLIWNLPCRVTCPYATEACKQFCYADKAELAYPDCKPSRIRNFEESREPDFVRRMVYTILRKRKGMRARKLVVRIHESGDFYNKQYALAWVRIAWLISMYGFTADDITFIAYTKSFPFFDGLQLPPNFRLRASLDSTSLKYLVDMVKRNGWCIYRVVDKFTDPENENNCRCSDCATCGKCWDLEIRVIECEVH